MIVVITDVEKKTRKTYETTNPVRMIAVLGAMRQPPVLRFLRSGKRSCTRLFRVA